MAETDAVRRLIIEDRGEENVFKQLSRYAISKNVGCSITSTTGIIAFFDESWV